MFIEKIRAFLPEYGNFTVEEFLIMLETSNVRKFDRFKFEKDFLLSLVLMKFGKTFPDLVFKGGTCLNKIYFPYFRLSEDLDFVLDIDAGRTVRQAILKKYEEDFVKELKMLGLALRDERTKFDEHRLAMFTFEYISAIDSSSQTIKIDISFK